MKCVCGRGMDKKEVHVAPGVCEFFNWCSCCGRVFYAGWAGYGTEASWLMPENAAVAPDEPEPEPVIEDATLRQLMKDVFGGSGGLFLLVSPEASGKTLVATLRVEEDE